MKTFDELKEIAATLTADDRDIAENITKRSGEICQILRK